MRKTTTGSSLRCGRREKLLVRPALPRRIISGRAAVKAGVISKDYKGRFGFHNLRHSLATYFAANDVNLPVIQSILRHAKPGTTAVYLHRVNKTQMGSAGEVS